MKKKRNKQMDKERVRGFQKSFEASAQRSMTEHQKDVMYRCFLLELDEAAIKVVLSAETPCKEEYLIASFLDGIDMQFVEMELVPEHQISVIQEKRIGFQLKFTNLLHILEQPFCNLSRRNITSLQ